MKHNSTFRKSAQPRAIGSTNSFSGLNTDRSIRIHGQSLTSRQASRLVKSAIALVENEQFRMELAAFYFSHPDELPSLGARKALGESINEIMSNRPIELGAILMAQ